MTTNPVPSIKAEDLLENAKTVDEYVNSPALTAQTRLGIFRRTLAGIDADFDAMQAGEFTNRAEAAASSAESEADRAEAARDAAFVNANVYADVATGRAAVADGDQFQVVSADGLQVIRYRRNSSSTQTEVARYPSATFVQNVELLAQRNPVVAYPNTDFRLTDPVITTVSANGVILKKQTPRSFPSRFTPYPYRSFDDRYEYVSVDLDGRVIGSAIGRLTQDTPDEPSLSSGGSMYVSVDAGTNRAVCAWQHGQDKMLRVTYQPNGVNALFNWRQTDIAPTGNPAAAAWTRIHSTNSDSFPPFIFRAVNDGDSGTTIYTGGNHSSDGGTGGVPTAEMTEIAFWVDGRKLAPGESYVGYADVVHVDWTNDVMAYNTITTGRYALRQRIRAQFRAGSVDAYSAITALEDIVMELDNGPQMFSDGYDTYHFYGGQQQGTLPIPTDGSSSTSGPFGSWPAWACVFASSTNGYHGVWIDRTFEAGDGRYLTGSIGSFRKSSGLKFYSAMVGTGDLSMTAGDSYEWHGGYFWAPKDNLSGDVDSAFTFYRRGIPHLGYALTASGAGRINLPSVLSGLEVTDLGTDGVLGVPVTATGYKTEFKKIKE